jgi:hypothetical protein
MKTKICSKCKVEKELCDFHNSKTEKDGKKYQCKSCVKLDYKYVKKTPSLTTSQIIEKEKLRKSKKSTYNKKYREENYQKIKQRNCIWKKNRLSNNPLVKLRFRISNNITVSLKRNGGKKLCKTTDILGCSFDDFKRHIESLWESWMSWENYGNPKDNVYEPNKTWDLDHIIPSSKATTEEEILKLNHYSNFQPLCSYNNRFIKKGN